MVFSWLSVFLTSEIRLSNVELRDLLFLVLKTSVVYPFCHFFVDWRILSQSHLPYKVLNQSTWLFEIFPLMLYLLWGEVPRIACCIPDVKAPQFCNKRGWSSLYCGKDISGYVKMVILWRERLQDGGFEIFGKKKESISYVMPGRDASNKDNRTHLPQNGSVIKVHIFNREFLLPTKASFCCLRSECILKPACSIIHLSILIRVTSAAQ